MTQPVRPRRDTDKDQELLLRLRERLQQIKRRLIDIEARVDALRTTEKAVTREFTEKQLNGKRSDDQETYASHQCQRSLWQAGLRLCHLRRRLSLPGR